MSGVRRREQPRRELRDQVIEIRVSATEREDLMAAAHRRGLSLSALIRSTITMAMSHEAGHDDEEIRDR